MKILITGGTGLLGSSFLKIKTEHNLKLIGTKQCDLRSYDQTEKIISNLKPDAIIHLAARVGGIKGNSNYLADFFTENININTNLLKAAQFNKISKVVCLLSSCIYPDNATFPLTEEQIHNGEPHQSNFGYAYAKRMMEVHCRAIRSQYGLNYITAIPNNLYGENDNFDLENSHVIPALIRKIWEAKINNKPYFEVWGDGEVYREFSYAEDIAKIILFCLENYSEKEPINIGNTQEYFLKDIINLIKKELDYNGNIVYDKTKPKGQVRKPTSNQKLISLGWKQEDYTSLEEGIKKTCKWFKKTYPNIRGFN